MVVVLATSKDVQSVDEWMSDHRGGKAKRKERKMERERERKRASGQVKAAKSSRKKNKLTGLQTGEQSKD